jgi:recombination protein RecR
MNVSSKLLEEAVQAFNNLPGIGKKTALRLVLHLLENEKQEVEQFAQAIVKMRNEIQFCVVCHNISDKELCEICSNKHRHSSTICVVADFRDIIAIENTGQFRGLYHVLGGLISPMEGISPRDLNIETLVTRASKDEVSEVILALSATMEGDTTNFYIFKKLNHLTLTISTLAKGIAIGNDLEYADELTLGSSINNRLPFDNSFIQK